METAESVGVMTVQSEKDSPSKRNSNNLVQGRARGLSSSFSSLMSGNFLGKKVEEKNEETQTRSAPPRFVIVKCSHCSPHPRRHKSPKHSKIFGVLLEEIVQKNVNNSLLPIFVTNVFNYLRESGKWDLASFLSISVISDYRLPESRGNL